MYTVHFEHHQSQRVFSGLIPAMLHAKTIGGRAEIKDGAGRLVVIVINGLPRWK